MANGVLRALTLRRLIAIAITVIVGFALLFPFVGGFVDTARDSNITYSVSDSLDAPASYLLVIFSKSLHLSVLTFTLVGAERLAPIGATRWLVDLEALLGMGFLALLVATLIEET